MAAVALAVSGCGHLNFKQGDYARGMPFYRGAPYLVRTVDGDCKVTTQVLMIPTERYVVEAWPGALGSSNLSVKFQNGMVTEFGQITDTNIDETIGALLGSAGAWGPKDKGLESTAAAPNPTTCRPTWAIVPVADSPPIVGMTDLEDVRVQTRTVTPSS